jgi:hypothetical protein
MVEHPAPPEHLQFSENDLPRHIQVTVENCDETYLLKCNKYYCGVNPITGTRERPRFVKAEGLKDISCSELLRLCQVTRRKGRIADQIKAYNKETNTWVELSWVLARINLAVQAVIDEFDRPNPKRVRT